MEEFNIKEKLEKYGQEHLLMFYDILDEKAKIKLLNDIKNLDLERITNLEDIQESTNIIEPISRVKKDELSEAKIQELECIGKNILESGKYAIVTMAGGQGTRLGHNGPKGTYKLSFKDKERYIFEIFVDYLKQAYEKHGVFIPWYIMTSKDNHDETISFFENNNYFAYPKEKIKFFKQGELAITDLDGKILLEEKDKVLKAADGNGGVFTAMENNNVLAEMKLNKIEWVLITGVDNILVNLADTFFIGLVDSEKKLNGVKSVAKANPEEKVGVFCKRNGKPGVVEYSELSDEMRYELNDNGELKYMEANIVNHLINIKVLEKIKQEKLPIHKAIKKQTYLDKQGNKITSYKPDTIKYEMFIFDYFKKVDDVTVYRVERDQEFAPVKNKEGIDSPITAKELYNKKFFKEN